VALAAASALGLLGAPLQAAGPAPTTLPSGLNVVQGSAQVATVLKGTAAQMTVRNSAGAILNWDSFNIGAQAGVHFQQADAASKVLNRVTGSDPSSIFGSLTSNGQVWLLNPNGVLFGAGARVDVAGLVASTLRLDDNAFLDGLRSGRFSFADGAAGATVRNEGALRTAHGGHLVLLAERVENAGTLDAPGGALLMAGAKSATLVDSALPYLAAVVPAGEVLNLGRAAADGGVVDVYASVVNQQGLVRADTVALDAQGRVVLKAADTLMLADGSTTQATGTAAGSTGGRIDLLGARVGLVGTATVDVSGDAAGGAVRVGGGLQGQDRTVDNAQAVYIGPEARLRADATGATGTGGSLIVWSDTATRAWGHFSARGGLAGGDGGFIETSGGWIDARPASIDVTSRGGRAGTWLIDPNNLTISNTGPDTAITGGPSFTTTGDGAVISTATIAAALNAGSSVTLTTAAAGASTEAGDILMLGATLTVAPTAPVTLTLNATRDIVVQNSSITSTGSPLSLDFRAAGSGAGVIDIYNSLISTAGGNVSLGGQNILTLPLPGGDTLPGTFRPAVSYLAASGPPSLSRSGGATAINIEASTLELGSGNLFAVGFGAIENRDAVVVGSLSDAGTIVRGASLELVGVSFVPTPVDFDAGLAFVGNATDVVASQSIDLMGAGRIGVVIESGARLTLNGTVGAGAGVAMMGWGRDEAGTVLVAGGDTGPVGRGSRLTVNNGSVLLQGSATDVGVAGVALYNFDGSPGPILALAAATDATLETLSSGPYTATGLRIGPVDITPPTAGTLTLRAPGELSINELFVTGTAGALVLQGQRIVIDNSVFSSTAAPLSLSFVSAGTNAQGVSLTGTIIETRGGDVTFGDLRTVSSPILGVTTVAANWIETDSTDASAALSITDSVIDAGSGRIVGGGAVASGGFNAVGLDIFRSVLTGSSIQLAGRSDYEQGLVLAESTLNATSVLSLAGDSASNFPPAAFGLQIGERSTLQLVDPTAAAGSSFNLRGRQLADGIGLLIEGGAVGSGNETRLAIEGAAATLSGTSGNGSGLVLRGSAAASGGVLVSAAAAPSLRLEGQVTLGAATGGTGTGLQLFHARVIGPQLAASSPLDMVANGGGAVGAGLRLEFSSISSGGVTTVAGNSILVSNSRLTGDGSINFFAVDQGASAGSVVIEQSSVQTAAPTARVFAGTRAGGPAIGVAGIAGGAGVLLTDSELEASDGGGIVELRGTGSATGGRGIEFARTPLTATTLTLVGRGSFDGDGVFADDVGAGLSPLTATTLTIDGLAAHNPAATSLTRAGVVLGRGVQLNLRSGGAALITGDLISLGLNANMVATAATNFSATGSPASFNVEASRSVLLRDATLDFSTGSGTNVGIRADTDGTAGGRVRLNTNTAILSGGGDISIEGQGVSGGPLATVVFEGGTGVFLTGAELGAGAGQITITGRTTDPGGPTGGEPSLSGVVLGGTGASNFVTGSRVSISGTAFGAGFGVTIGEVGSSALIVHSINGSESVVINGTGIGASTLTTRRAPGIRILDSGIIDAGLSANLSGLGGSGIELNNGAVRSTGSASIVADGPVRLVGSSLLQATGSLSINGIGTPASAPAAAEPGVLVAAGTDLQAATIAIDATQAAGSVAIKFDAPSGSGTVQATAGDLLLSVGPTLADGYVEIIGDWTFSTPANLGITTPQRLALASDASGLVAPRFTAAAVSIDIAASSARTFGGGFGDLDISLLNAAVAGMSATSTVTLSVTGGAAVTIDGTLNVPGRLRLRADDITLAADSQMRAGAAGDAIVIGGDSSSFTGVFFNDAGSSALFTPAGRWVVLAASPASTTMGGLAYTFSAFGLGGAPWGVDGAGDLVTPLAGNALGYGITTAAASGAALSVSQTRAYDTTANLTLDPGSWTVGGLVAGDTLALAGSTAATMADKNVGVDKPVTPDAAAVFSVTDADGRPVFGYGAPALRATITPVALTASGIVVASKVYDGTTAATLTSLGTVSPLAGDVVSVGGTVVAAFADKNAGTEKVVNVTGLALTGVDAGNYTLTPPTGLLADVTPRPLAVTGVTALGKVYDATPLATLAGTATIAPLGGDVVTLAGTGSGAFADKNVGTAKAVTVSGYTLAGTDATNYAIVQPAGLSADITPATLAVTGLSAASRVYDATTAATLSGTAVLAPALGADVVTLSGTASGSFADKNVGTAKAVALGGLSLAGADAGNYVITAPGLSADITPATLAVTGLAALPKVYDATTVAPLGGSASVAPLGSDVVTLAGTAAGTFADKNVGAGKAVTVTGLTLAGAEAGNYTIALPTGLSADVTARALAVTGVAAAGKVYDSTTTATLTGTATIAPLGGDIVTLAGTASAAFSDKNVGTAKAVTVSGYTLAGADAGNYAIVQPAGLSADITAAPLAVTGLAAVSRVYDRSTVAALSGTAAVSPLGSDVVTLAGTATGAFATAGVGTGKAVSVAGLSLAGADAGNYRLVLPAGLTADVTPRTLSLAGLAAASRVYDAGTTAAVSGSLAGVLTGDVVSVSLGGAFADANVGSAKPVTVSATLAGADAANYTLAAPPGLSASITPATLRYVAVPAFGTSGQALPALTGSVSGFLGADTLASATTGTLAWTTPAGAASPAGLYAINGGGLSALNYGFVQDAANATALTLRAAAVSDPVTTATTVVTTTALFSVSVPLLMSTPTEGRTLDVTPAFAVSVGAEAERRARIASAAGGEGAGRPAPGVAGGTAAVTAPGSVPGPAPDGSTGAPAPGAVAPSTAAAAAALPSLSAAVSAASAEAAGGLSYAPLDFSRLPRDEVQTLLAARARYKQQIFADGIHRLQQDPTLADVRACRNEAELDSGQCLITEDLKRQIQAARDEARRRAEAAAAAAAAVPGAAATPQAARLQRRVVQAALPVIERKLALLIGVNDYRDKAVPQLAGAVRDARAVRERLEQRLGYETTVLESPGRDDIVRAFNRLALEARPGDSVIVYYAGHGVVVPVDGVDTGFWLPADVDSRKESTWLSNADIARLIAAIGSRQLMLVSDSCYSGTLVGKERSSVSGDNPDEMLKRRAAVVMSSGGDEPVADEGKDGHSFFAWHFMRALEGLDRWQAGNSLYDRLRGAVSREFPQTPQYGGSRGLGHEGGTDYLFERRQIEAGAKAP
jgi:filamentous hemagglutinin family protein